MRPRIKVVRGERKRSRKQARTAGVVEVKAICVAGANKLPVAAEVLDLQSMVNKQRRDKAFEVTPAI